MSENICNLACDILAKTNDGNNLCPLELKLIENGVNGYLNEQGIELIKELHQKVIKGNYKKPYLHDIEYLTIDHEGYIYWKNKEVEHYEIYWAFTDEGKKAAVELTIRCQHLENIKVEVNCTNAIWQWEKYQGVAP